MEDTALLTDDEIVALRAASGKPWPAPLLTVPATAEELANAGMRGMRSLMVRRLAGGDAEAPGFRPHEYIARDAAAFAESTDRIGAYVAPASDPTQLGGASITAARSTDGWVIDTVTATGIHALRQTSADEAAKAGLAFVESAYAGTLFTGDDADQLVCAVRFGPDSRNALAVRPHSVTGTVDGAPVTGWLTETCSAGPSTDPLEWHVSIPHPTGRSFRPTGHRVRTGSPILPGHRRRRGGCSGPMTQIRSTDPPNPTIFTGQLNPSVTPAGRCG